MTDISERLRNMAEWLNETFESPPEVQALVEAADALDTKDALLKEVRQYVADAVDDEDPETQTNARLLIEQIDRETAR